jgi:hypothetical protein
MVEKKKLTTTTTTTTTTNTTITTTTTTSTTTKIRRRKKFQANMEFRIITDFIEKSNFGGYLIRSLQIYKQ